MPSVLYTEALRDRDFFRLRHFIQKEIGIQLPDAKRTMLEGRIRKRLRALQLSSLAAYCDYLFSPNGQAGEASHLLDVVTTNKTSFFREGSHFEYLTETVLSQLDTAERRAKGPFLVWSAGCSTGEEPYTLAIVLNEYAERKTGFQFQILATDISSEVLQKAHLAVFNADVVESIPRHLTQKYFLRSRDPKKRLFRAAPELRDRMDFRRLNFMDASYEMPRVDVVFCRNVLIYFDRDTQFNVITRFCHHLPVGGYLFLGHSETTHGLDLPLDMTSPTVYRKIKRNIQQDAARGE